MPLSSSLREIFFSPSRSILATIITCPLVLVPAIAPISSGKLKVKKKTPILYIAYDEEAARVAGVKVDSY